MDAKRLGRELAYRFGAVFGLLFARYIKRLEERIEALERRLAKAERAG